MAIPPIGHDPRCARAGHAVAGRALAGHNVCIVVIPRTLLYTRGPSVRRAKMGHRMRQRIY